MNKEKLGNLEQACFVRPIEYTDGRAKGLEALQFYNGVLDFTVLKSKCMDLGEMRYKGINIGFLSKTGLMANQIYDLDMDLDQQSGLMAGFMFTCGLSNAGAKCEVDGIKYPFHGQIRSTPAEKVSFGTDPETLECYATGEVRECVLQSRNLSIKRKVSTKYGEPEITISDVITNDGYTDEPVLLIYHFDFGWPLLDEDTKIIVPVETDRSPLMGETVPGEEETVYKWNPDADADGNVTCRIENDKLGIGAMLTYQKEVLPVLGEWRSNASGDYVLGFEPGLCGVEGRKELLDNGTARILKPHESIYPELKIRFYDL